MKENFPNNFVKKTGNNVKKGLVYGAVAAASFFPMKSEAVTMDNSLNQDKNKKEVVKSKIEKMSTENMEFSEFNPIPGDKKIHIADKKLEAYVAGNCSLDEMRINNKYINESKWMGVKNFANFKKEILLVAEKMGYSEGDIKKLSIHDAIMLSGNILKEKLSYNHDMLDKDLTNEKNIEKKALKELEFAFSGKDNRNEEAKRIDKKYCDEIFSEGLAICRNYAAVNKAVFDVLKSMNNDLKNVYMNWYSPNSLHEIVVLPHAWNQVINVSEKNDSLRLDITYVDPTWLDTRKTTVDASGERVMADNEKVYNAFNNAHFFNGCISAYTEMAKLYELLGSNNRRFTIDNRYDNSKTPFTDEKILSSYMEQAYTERIRICRIAIDSAKNIVVENYKKEALFNEFRVSFLEAVSNINGSPVGYASNITPTYFDFVNNSNDRATVNRIKELVNILSEAEKVFYSTPGKDIKMESIDPQSDDNNPMKVERAVSIFDLKEKINNLAGKDIH
jgi:hypothetical protein